jgi:hypothetical protein
MGEGLEGTVYTLLVHGDDLYAGGDFSVPGTPGASDVARWDGHQWMPLAVDTSGRILALEWYENRLVAGGIFDEIGGALAQNVAAFDGAKWQSLGAGIQPAPNGGGVASLCAWSGRLYVGGTFVAAGGRPSYNIARWRDPEVVPAMTLTLVARRGPEGVTLRWSGSEPMDPDPIQIWRADEGSFRQLTVVEGRSWRDDTTRSDRSYRYRVATPSGLVSNTSTVEASTPRSWIASVAPNPFDPRTEIRLRIAQPGLVTVRIFDLAGREVWSWREHVEAGPVALVWDGLDDAGVAVARGVYLVRLQSGAGVDTRRVVRLD